MNKTFHFAVRSMLLAALPAACLLVTGCASTSSREPIRVAVFSNMGDTGKVTTSRAPFFFWDREFDASGWQLDAAIEEYVEAKLAKRSNVQIVAADRTPYRSRVRRTRSATVTGVQRPGTQLPLRFEGRDSESTDALEEWAREAGADRILLISSDRVDEYIHETGRRIENYGIFQRLLIGNKREYAFAVMNFWLLDAERSRVRDGDLAREYDKIIGFTFVEEDEELPPERIASWRENVWPVVKRSIDERLSHIRVR